MSACPDCIDDVCSRCYMAHVSGSQAESPSAVARYLGRELERARELLASTVAQCEAHLQARLKAEEALEAIARAIEAPAEEEPPEPVGIALSAEDAARLLDEIDYARDTPLSQDPDSGTITTVGQICGEALALLDGAK
jgi:hypothetical protein